MQSVQVFVYMNRYRRNGANWSTAVYEKRRYADIAFLSEMNRVNILHQVLSDFVRKLQGNHNWN